MLAPPQRDRPPETRQIYELDDGPVLHPRPLTAVGAGRSDHDRLDGDLEVADHRLDYVQHVHRRKTYQQLARAPVDALIVPADLESALRRSERAREAYEALSTSAKRSVLYSLYSAKREATRAKRVADALAALEGGESLGRRGGQ